MPVFELNKDSIKVLTETTFTALGLQERADIQRLLRSCIEVIAPNTMVISEEFGNWTEGSRRIDLLALHNSGDIVVIELKREDAGHMELQALRYAAMVSTMTLPQAVDAYRDYLNSQGKNEETAEEDINKFLGPEAKFGTAVRIVLAATTFSKEITSTVLWLNEAGLDISCVRLTPYRNDGQVLLDVDRFIPLPGAEDYQVAVRNKAVADKVAETERRKRNSAKYSLITAEQTLDSLTKRDLAFNIINLALKAGISVEQLQAAIPWKKALLLRAAGTPTLAEILPIVQPQAEAAGLNLERHYAKDPERLMRHDGVTYLMRGDWGPRTEEAARNVMQILPPGHVISLSVEQALNLA